MKELNLIQGTEPWKKWRKGIIGGSDAPVIMQVFPWKDRTRLWKEKMDLIEDSPKNEDMERGIRLEPEARQFLSEELGIQLEPIVAKHSQIEWMCASLDGISKDRKIAVEIKCPRNMHQSIPTYYYPQLQHIMEVCDLDQIYYLSFVKHDDQGISNILTVKRDDVYIETLKKAEEEFVGWLDKWDLPPQKYKERNDSQWAQLAIEWIEAKEKLNWWELYEKALRKKVIDESDGENITGCGIKISKEIRKGQIDYQKVPVLEGVDLEPYRKPPIECWKIIKEKSND